jgi:hypothetical protein
MHRLSLFGICVLAACASTLKPAHSRITREIPFSASTLGDTSWADTGRFEGTARVSEDRIEVIIPQAVIRYGPVAGSYPTNVHVGLAFGDTAGEWDIRRHSNAVPISRVLRPGSDVASDTLRFVIEVPASVDLSRHWLVFILGSSAIDPESGRRVQATTYTHTQMKLFNDGATLPTPRQGKRVSIGREVQLPEPIVSRRAA